MSGGRIERLRLELSCLFEVKLRGEGLGSFLYITKSGRAVELSKAESGGWWIEFWEASEDEDAPPVRDVVVESDEEAKQEIRKWLQ